MPILKFLLLFNLGLWAPCEGENETLSSSSKIIEMLNFAQQMGVKDVFLQVYRRNHSWYPSSLADDTPYRSIFSKEKIDPLAFAIQEAHKRGLRIHAWFNIFWIGKDLNVPVIKKLGQEIVTRDQKGRSMASYPDYRIPGSDGKYFSYGEDGYWLDPGDDRVQTYLLDLFKEVIQNYPDLNGIHLDFVRYPYASPYFPGSYYSMNRGIEFGYGKRSCERFKKTYGIDPLKMERKIENHQLWDQWRRDQITNFVNHIHQMLGGQKIPIKLSCAVLPWPERSYFSSFQDWTRWAKEGTVDFIVIMNYTLDLHLAETLSRMAMSVAEKAEVWIGLGPYMFEENARSFQKEFQETLDLKPKGIVFFSYDTLLKQKSIVDEIKNTLRRTNGNRQKAA